MRSPRATWAIVSVSILAGAGLALTSVLDRLPEPPQVSFEGRVPPRDVPLERWVAERADNDGKAQVLMRLPGGALVVARRDLGLSLDATAALADLRRPRPKLSRMRRLSVAFGGVPPQPLEVPARYRFDASRAAAWLAQIAEGLREEPVDARLDLPKHQRVEARAGRELDAGASLAQLATLGAGTQVDLVFRELLPAVPTSALANVDPSLVLSEYETDFSKRGGPRVRNIARAARYLDGTLMAPGEIWSFNRNVGPRTAERGFVDAPVIVADELEQGVGGGVCQVATTLFASAVLGGLDIIKRRSHSRPSGYAPLGLDATVIDREVDLQLRNPYPVPVIVHAFLPTPTTIKVEMLGLSPPGKIEHSYTVKKSEDFYRRVARHPELAPGQIKRQQKGIPGFEVVSTIRTRFVDGSERVRRYDSTYYPVPEVYWVAADVDPNSLPPLPERATHTELSEERSETTPAAFSP